MAKAVIQDVLDLGFDAKQFGDPATFATASGYVDTILTGIGLIVAEKVGSAYASASGLTLYYITEAEKYLTAAELMRRLANFEVKRLSASRTDKEVEAENERLLKRAQIYEDHAMLQLQALGVDVSGGIAVGYVETTHFGAVA